MDKPSRYRIKIKGVFPINWIDKLGGLQVVEQSSEGMTLEGWLPDQASLNGALDIIYGLNLPLVEVKSLQDHKSNKNV